LSQLLEGPEVCLQQLWVQLRRLVEFCLQQLLEEVHQRRLLKLKLLMKAHGAAPGDELALEVLLRLLDRLFGGLKEPHKQFLSLFELFVNL